MQCIYLKLFKYSIFFEVKIVEEEFFPTHSQNCNYSYISGKILIINSK